MIPKVAVVLAGEREGGNALARAHGVPSALVVDLAGRPVIDWSLSAVTASDVERTVLVGPAAALAEHEVVRRWCARDDVTWVAPARGPAASAVVGASAAGTWPLLLTAADHALLRPALVHDFCARAAAEVDADLVVGVVPAERVRERFPDSQRTWLKFRDGACCGSNLFYLAGPGALRVLEFWQRLEALRKQPWRMAKQLGPSILARYLSGLLTLDDALRTIGARCGARLRAVRLEEPQLAVDVDSPADHRLAGELLRERGDAPA